MLRWVALSWLMVPPSSLSAVMAARDGVNTQGNPIYTDSFDSSDPIYSAKGLYDPSRASTNGDVLCLSGLASVPNDSIFGRLLLGSSTTYYLGTHGTVSGGIQIDLNLVFSDVAVPQTTWLPTITTNALIDGISYRYVFDGWSGDYSVNELTGGVYVGTNTHIRLLVSGSSAAFSNIRVAGSGNGAGQLKIYADASISSISGAVLVDKGDPARLIYYGTANNINLAFTRGAIVVGAIFAPHADLQYGDGGMAVYDFIGSVTAKTIKINGHVNFHFDENLWSIGCSLPDIVTQPASQSILTGQSTSLSVQARGQVGYQWQKNGALLAGETTSLLVITNASLNDAGSYTVIVTNLFGSLQSSAAVLTVIDPNLIDTDGDGMPDVWEVAHGFDPNDPCDAVADADGDGLSNFIEYALGSDPRNPADAYAFWNDARDPGCVCSNVVVWMSQSGTNHYLAMRYRARVDAAARQLQYLPEVSADGLIWYSDTNNVIGFGVGPADAEFNNVTVRDATAFTPARGRFMRLRVISTTP